MKFVVFLTLAIFAASVKSGDEMMMKVVQGCKTTVGATDDDLQKFLAHAAPENQAQKCMNSCLMTGLGIVSKNHINLRNIMKIIY
jgi:PBP/GOBP family